ncbi:fimbria/pilus periplasmic chaperone [Shewanella algae]|uniref:fimbria/pilus periplasmic chaperone n=1 Tax=Shewanella algae TaxID=38313 RepID=UPI000F41FF97|nr:fimbria/pilus periplasmic chaperone [Shewanella algae]AYV13682.1 fimbrial protein [Shewanella algae]
MKKLILTCTLLLGALSTSANAAVTMDRTRVIFPGQNDSISLNVINTNKALPYLAQAWLENSQGQKVNSPFMVLPPIQRLEANSQSLLKIQALPVAAQLPQDRETLFYFNLREIPPKSDKANTLQLALQTRVKFFYRPSSLIPKKDEAKVRWQEQLVLHQELGRYRLENPTPYFVTVTEAQASGISKTSDKLEPVMLAPKSSEVLNLTVKQLGQQPILTYVDDYGARRKLSFVCSSSSCSVDLSVKL